MSYCSRLLVLSIAPLFAFLLSKDSVHVHNRFPEKDSNNVPEASP